MKNVHVMRTNRESNTNGEVMEDVIVNYVRKWKHRYRTICANYKGQMV